LADDMAADGVEGMPIKEFLRKSNMGRMAEETLNLSEDELMEMAFEAGGELVQMEPKWVMKALEKLQAEHYSTMSVDEVANLQIPLEIAEPATKWVAAWLKPDEVKPVLAAWDKWINLTKDW